MDCFYLDCKLPGDQFYHTKDYYCVHESMLIDKVLSYELYEDLMMLD